MVDLAGEARLEGTVDADGVVEVEEGFWRRAAQLDGLALGIGVEGSERAGAAREATAGVAASNGAGVAIGAEGVATASSTMEPKARVGTAAFLDLLLGNPVAKIACFLLASSLPLLDHLDLPSPLTLSVCTSFGIPPLVCAA
jgi:hypothetical protein